MQVVYITLTIILVVFAVVFPLFIAPLIKKAIREDQAKYNNMAQQTSTTIPPSTTQQPKAQVTTTTTSVTTPVPQPPETITAKSEPELVNDFAELCQDSRQKVSGYLSLNNIKYGLTPTNIVGRNITFDQAGNTCNYEVDYFTLQDNPRYNPKTPGSSAKIQFKEGTKNISLPVDFVQKML